MENYPTPCFRFLGKTSWLTWQTRSKHVSRLPPYHAAALVTAEKIYPIRLRVPSFHKHQDHFAFYDRLVRGGGGGGELNS